MDVTQCLGTIVGLSQNECPCMPEPGDVERDGISAEYIDDPEHCVTLQYPLNEVDCKSSDIWELLTKARAKGVTNFMASYLQHLGAVMNNRLSGYTDHIGQKPSTFNALGQIGAAKTIVGFLWRPVSYLGIYHHINNIYLTVNTTGDYDVKLIDTDDPATVLKTVTVSAVAGIKKKVVFDELVPLSDGGRAKIYALYYDRDTANPYNFKFNCGCSSSGAPMWMKNNYFKANGFALEDINDLDITQSGTEYTYGLEINFTYQCSAMQWMCDQGNAFWTSTEHGIIAAKLIAKFAANWLQNAIISGPQPTPYTLIHGEQMAAKMAANMDVINQLMPLVVKDSQDKTHCYECKHKGFMKINKNYL